MAVLLYYLNYPERGGWIQHYLTAWRWLDSNVSCPAKTLELHIIIYARGDTFTPSHAAITCRYLCYTCIAEPPHIHPFTLADGYYEGGRVGWQCFITKGDGPLMIEWLKNNQSLDLASTPSLSVTHQNEYSSSVLIESIRLAHEGNYSCRATNPVATVEHTVTLTVLGT